MVLLKQGLVSSMQQTMLKTRFFFRISYRFRLNNPLIP